jgi:hypothetical protein
VEDDRVVRVDVVKKDVSVLVEGMVDVTVTSVTVTAVDTSVVTNVDVSLPTLVVERSSVESENMVERLITGTVVVVSAVVVLIVVLSVSKVCFGQSGSIS